MMEEPTVKLPEYYEITEKLNDEELFYFKKAIVEFESSNYGNCDYYQGKLPKEKWLFVDYYKNVLDGYYGVECEE